MTTEECLAAKRQLFNHKEAFQMLSKELVDVMRGAEPWLSADAVADDVYKWWGLTCFKYSLCPCPCMRVCNSLFLFLLAHFALGLSNTSCHDESIAQQNQHLDSSASACSAAGDLLSASIHLQGCVDLRHRWQLTAHAGTCTIAEIFSLNIHVLIE